MQRRSAVARPRVTKCSRRVCNNLATWRIGVRSYCGLCAARAALPLVGTRIKLKFTCGRCGEDLSRFAARGRRPKFCSGACRVASFYAARRARREEGA